MGVHNFSSGTRFPECESQLLSSSKDSTVPGNLLHLSEWHCVPSLMHWVSQHWISMNLNGAKNSREPPVTPPREILQDFWSEEQAFQAKDQLVLCLFSYHLNANGKPVQINLLTASSHLPVNDTNSLSKIFFIYLLHHICYSLICLVLSS